MYTHAKIVVVRGPFVQVKCVLWWVRLFWMLILPVSQGTAALFKLTLDHLSTISFCKLLWVTYSTSMCTCVCVCVSLVLLQGSGSASSHEMVIRSFDVPTKCDHCTSFMQGQVRQGMTCKGGSGRRASAGMQAREEYVRGCCWAVTIYVHVLRVETECTECIVRKHCKHLTQCSSVL